MIKEITKFIADNTSFTLGDTLQCGHRTPASPVQCNVVLESDPSGIYPDLPDRVDKMIQVISRAKTYMKARDDAWEIYKELFPNLNASGLPSGARTISASYEAQIIEPLSDPQYIGKDDKGRYEFSTNYIFRIRSL